MLNYSVSNTNELTSIEKHTMFQLYGSYYQGSNQAIFDRDLNAKDYVVVLKDDEQVIKGFTTLAVYNEIFQNKQIKVIFSGDTIVDKNYWGQNQLSKTWIEFAGRIKAQTPDISLYWLLIVKGHRTYRYLSLFSKDYYPRYDRRAPSDTQALMDYLAKERFGSAYDPESGLIKFAEPRSYLNQEIAVIPEKDQDRPDVNYFLQRNPRYFEGDELLCLCELRAENLTPLSRQWFEAGSVQAFA